MLKFTSSFARITVHSACVEDFNQFMAVKVPEIKRHLQNKSFASGFAIETAVKEHPEWFDISLSNLKPEKAVDSRHPAILYEGIKAGFVMMEATA